MSLQQRPSGRTRSTGRLAPGSFAPFQLPTQMPSPNGGPIAPVPGPDPLAPVTPPGALGQLSTLVRLDTLAGQFSALAILAALLSLLAMGVSFWVLNSAEDNFRRVIKDSSPSIIAAENLGQNFNSLDTAAADFQVTTRIDVTSPDFNPGVYGASGLRTQADQRYLQDRQALNDALYRARSNITYAGEADAINVISVRLFDYLARIEVMRNEISQGHREAALAQYKAAHDILVGNLYVDGDGKQSLTNGRSPEEILEQDGWRNLNVNTQYLGINANIAKLLKINQNELSKASDSVINAAVLNLILVIVAIVLVLGIALWLSVRYAMITHRIINPGFVIGLVLALGMLVWLSSNLIQANNDYKTISRDSFLTINAASQAKQALLDFKGDESRLLLSVNSSGLDSTNPDLTSEVRQAFDPALLTQNFTTKKDLVETQLKTAWANVNYAGERKALCGVLDNPGVSKCATSERPRDTSTNNVLPFAWTEYLNQHQQIVDQFNKGLLADAIKISFGPSTTQEKRVSDGLDALAKVNQDAFDTASCSAIGQAQFKSSCGNSVGYLTSLETANWIIFPIIAVLALGGAWYARRLL